VQAEFLRLCDAGEMLLNAPVKSYSVNFVADGASNTLAVDLGLTPINEELNGAAPIGVLAPVVTSTFSGPIAGVTAAIQGSVVTFTFPTAPAKFDLSSNLVVYTATFLIQYGT
jgi:hypothetical protein